MKVLLLAGGDSNEREVSLTSGAAVCGALQRLGHEVVALDPGTARPLVTQEGKLVETLSSEDGESESMASLPQVAEALSLDRYSNVDVVFIALHGGRGENGSIQNLLSMGGMKFTGSPMAASAVAMNKSISKRVMASLGIETPRWGLVERAGRDSVSNIADEINHQFGLPVIIKPNEGGSTIGLTLVKQAGKIADALDLAWQEGGAAMVEEYIEGRELTVSVLDSEPQPVVEIVPKSGLYDYEAKYTKGMSEYIVPAEITDEAASQLMTDAVQLYDAIGARGLARVDFLMAETTRTYCLELNTVPGLTELSLAPMALKANGVSFDQLIERLISTAHARQD